jgi:hypothetical protein
MLAEASTVPAMHLRVPALAGALLLSAACESRPSDPPPLASAVIDPTGGSLELTGGPLAGARILVPEDALAATTTFAIGNAQRPAWPGYRSVGPGVHMSPPGLVFQKPLLIRVPFDLLQWTFNPLVLLRLEASGAVTEVGPVPPVFSSPVELEVGSLGTFWVAERMFGGFATDGYLPIDDGNRWQLTNGIAIACDFTAMEPNLVGVPIQRFSIETPDASLAFYLQLGTSGIEIQGAAFADAAASSQFVHAPSLFLQSPTTVGQEITAARAFAHHAPLGSTEDPGEGNAVANLSLHQPSSRSTPLGTFRDVVELRWQTSYAEAGGATRTTVCTLTLARNVGPVAVTALGLTGELESGTVGGAPITPPRR